MGGYRRSILAATAALALATIPASHLSAGTQSAPAAEVYEGPSCFGTVISGLAGGNARILGSRDAGQAIYSEGDVVFLENAAGLVAGDRYTVYRIQGVAEHPATGMEVGRIVLLVGSLEVSEVEGDRAVARIGPSCGELEPDDLLTADVRGRLAARPEMPAYDPLRLVRPREADGTVVYGASETLHDAESGGGRRDMIVRTSHVAGDIVTLDRGTADGWGAGSVVLFYETRPMVEEDPLSHDEPVVAAQGYVIRSEVDTAAVLITEGDRAVAIGARARRLR